MRNSKKGVFGIDTVKLVILSALIIAILLVAGFLVLTSMSTAYDDTETKLSGTNKNETVNSLTEVAQPLSVYKLRNVACTIVQVQNKSNNVGFSSTNYSMTGAGNCYIKTANNGVANESNVNVTYTYKYNSGEVQGIVGNISIGSTNFFAQSGTWFTLLAVAVLVLIIAVVIVVVSRFGGAEGGVGEGGLSLGKGGGGREIDEL